MPRARPTRPTKRMRRPPSPPSIPPRPIRRNRVTCAPKRPAHCLPRTSQSHPRGGRKRAETQEPNGPRLAVLPSNGREPPPRFANSGICGGRVTRRWLLSAGSRRGIAPRHEANREHASADRGANRGTESSGGGAVSISRRFVDALPAETQIMLAPQIEADQAKDEARRIQRRGKCQPTGRPRKPRLTDAEAEESRAGRRCYMRDLMRVKREAVSKISRAP